MSARRARLGAVAALLACVLASSCAYYNTYYLARKYYDRGASGNPYLVDKADGSAVANFSKSIEYSKKLLGAYPKSKWVDDAYLLWARSLLGKEDPIQTVNMLRDFSTRYPQSPLKDEAVFYRAVGSRRARMYTEALSGFDEFLKKSPRHDLAPYALLERAGVLLALDRPADAVTSAGAVIERYPKSRLGDRALLMRAEALLDMGATERARADYHLLGTRAGTDEERFGFLLKEAECFEAGHRYDQELALLQAAAGHEEEPQRANTVAAQGMPVNQSNDRWGRLQLRIGAVHMLAGRTDKALDTFRRVIDLFPRTPLAAEGQYRVGYTYETTSDDFERARIEYGKVQTQSSTSQFAAQAALRLASLDRLAQYRSSGGPDSVGKKAEAGFLLAEQYLFQLDKPDRALEQYRSIEAEFPGSEYAAKAMNGEAWVLRNKYEQKATADSILWAVVRNYPKTEAQMDARDYLERYGHQVPAELIQPPDSTRLAARDSLVLTSPPARVDSIGVRPRLTPLDSLLRLGLIRAGDAPPGVTGPRPPAGTSPPGPTPSTPTAPAKTDSTRLARPDSTRFVPAKPDTTGKHP